MITIIWPTGAREARADIRSNNKGERATAMLQARKMKEVLGLKAQ